MHLDLSNMKKFYTIKSGEDWTKCPLCGSKLEGCHLGDYCSNDKCSYVDGLVRLTDEEAVKFKDKLL